MEIPYARLEPEILKRVIEEFVTREGTDYGQEYTLDDKITQVMKQLQSGHAKILFDQETETCTIAMR